MRARRLLLGLSLASLTLFAHASAARAEGAERRDRCNRHPLIQRTYAVADLVVPIDMDNEPGKPADRTTREDRLIQLILCSVAPDSWEACGGPGTMQYFPLGMGLVVRQTAPVHEEISELLSALRRLQDVEIAVELRVLHVSDEILGRLRKEQCAGRCRAGAKMIAVLGDNGLQEFLKGAQGDRSTAVMQAPKITVFNGQRAAIRVIEEMPFVTDLEVCREENRIVLRPKTETIETGLVCAVWPVASADRRSVKMRLNVELMAFGGTVAMPVVAATRGESGEEHLAPVGQTVYRPARNINSVETTLDIPDGRTAVFHAGTAEVERRCEFGPPCKIPYLNRLFKNVGYGRERQNVLVLVTPRVIVNEEVEK